jgi:DnaJ-domain-containing protein 1
MAEGFMDGYKTYDTSNGYGSRRKWKSAFHSRMTGEEAEEIIRETKESPYTILGVTTSSTQAEILSAYRKLIKQWHPDRCTLPNAEEMAKKIIAAYIILKS